MSSPSIDISPSDISPSDTPPTTPSTAPSRAPSVGPSLEPSVGPSIAPKTKDIKTASATTPSEIMQEIFKKSNIVMLLWFLAIYLVVYFLISMFRRPSDTTSSHISTVSRTFDFIILVGVGVMLVMTFYFKTQAEKEQLVQDGFTAFIDYVDTPVSLFATALFIFALYLCIFMVGIPMTYGSKPFSISIVETIAWLVFVVSMIFVFFKTVLHIDLKEFFTKLWNDTWNPTSPAEEEEDEKDNTPKEEVFNVGDNLYTYEDAQTVCSAYGARLATYDEIEQAYQQGAEWCNYGWSDGQMAFFPTQKDTWDKLQKNEKTKNSCGRPGINGGFIDNPNVRFGINCYGLKPKPSDKELEILKERQLSPDSALPKTEEDIILEKKIKYWKEHGDKILRLNSYNNKQWSAY
jgi:hypothetical protein